MILYISVRDFAAFYRKEKGVFVWLLVSMVFTSFLMNASYSFAKERGRLFNKYSGADIPMVWVYLDKKTGFDKYDSLEKKLADSGLPKEKSSSLLVNAGKGITVIGRDEITPDFSVLSGIWTEGYFSKITEETGNECAVDASLLDYGDKNVMVGEQFEFEGHSYTIKGVYEDREYVDVTLFKDTFRKNFDGFDTLFFVFKKSMNSEERTEFEKLAASELGSARFSYNDDRMEEGQALEVTQRVQYSIFILLLVVFITYIIRFWHERNISTYTIYRLNGATAGKIVAIIATEALLLGVSTYVLGLAADALLLLVIHKNLITLESIGFGFALFFVPMFILTVTNAVQLCKGFNITDIRRD